MNEIIHLHKDYKDVWNHTKNEMSDFPPTNSLHIEMPPSPS